MYNPLFLHNLPIQKDNTMDSLRNRRECEAYNHMISSYAIEDEFPEIDEYGPYSKAYWYAKEYTGPMSEEFVLDLARMMFGGHIYYRNSNNNFGCDYADVVPELVHLCGGWLGVWNRIEDSGWFEDSIESTYEFLAEFHIRFEHIHPFDDGNGRIGRLLLVYASERTGLHIQINDKRLYKKAVANEDIDKLATLFQGL